MKMALSVNTNIGSLNAMAAATSTNKQMEISMERLSTGKRINTAADDAAGVAIASRLTSEIRGTNQAIRNAMDAQALIDTAEGAHNEIVNILQRMREIAVQAANDTNDSDDRDNLQTEANLLIDEIDRIASVSTWAGQVLLDGSGGASSNGSFSFLVGVGSSGTSSSDTITITIDNMDSDELGVDGGSGANTGSIDLLSSSAAIDSITLIDDAITTVNTQRAELGSYSNRLDYTVSNLTNIASNLEAGRGRIEDADFAAESSSLAKSQILQQAATAMLAQANASKQGVLQLLKG
jgi:flagellin